MKKTILLSFILIFNNLLSADKNNTPDYRLIVASGLNVRSAPSKKARVLFRILLSGWFKILQISQNKEWYKIQRLSRGRTGWVSGQFVETIYSSSTTGTDILKKNCIR